MSALSMLNVDKFAALSERLSLAEKECSKFRTQWDIKCESDEVTPEHGLRLSQKTKRKMNQFRGKGQQSLFDRIENPAPSRAIARSIPDHHKNPHKWTKYSLGDISIADMSESNNAQAAFSFLNELKSRKQLTSRASKETEPMDISEPVLFNSKNKTNSKFVFRKPKNDTAVNTEVSSVIPENYSKPTFRNSKVVMPEYIVGQQQIKKSQKKKKLSEAVNCSKNVKLHHLQDLEEEQEEEIED